MSKGKILVTDSLFILPEHEAILSKAGYEIIRLDKPDASEAELIKNVKGKVGYILGGIEKVTDKVIEAADKLKVISFTGADPYAFIPGFKKATRNKIAITTTPGANAFAVSEYTLTLMLAMTRDIFELGRTGEQQFKTTKSLKDLTVGVVGMGTIGTRVAHILHSFGVHQILYSNRTPKPHLEEKYHMKHVELDKLLKKSDIVTLHVSKEVGDGYIGKDQLKLMRNGSLIVNCGFMGCIDRDALLPELTKRRIRAAEDGPSDERFKDIPLSHWYCSNAHTAYNTYEANRVASDMAVRSLLNILENGTDEYKVN